MPRNPRIFHFLHFFWKAHPSHNFFKIFLSKMPPLPEFRQLIIWFYNYLTTFRKNLSLLEEGEGGCLVVVVVWYDFYDTWLSKHVVRFHILCRSFSASTRSFFLCDDSLNSLCFGGSFSVWRVILNFQLDYLLFLALLWFQQYCLNSWYTYILVGH